MNLLLPLETTDDRVRLAAARFRRFKALNDFSLDFAHTTALVGANNAGKSSIIGALRLLASGLSIARARKPVLVELGFETFRAHKIPADVVPVSLENVHTNLEDSISSVEFSLTNGHVLRLVFQRDGSPFLVPL